MTIQYSFFSGFNSEGEKVRPSDWVLRIALLTATRSNDKRMKYHNACMPIVCNNEVCLRIDLEYMKSNCPNMYNDIMFTLNTLDTIQIIMDSHQ